MKQEKINISLEKEILRCNKNGKISSGKFPIAFGDKNKNNFITSDKEDYILKLKTPNCKNINEAYNKLEEILNVVYVELYNLNEIIWPFSNFQNIELTNTIKLSIDKEFYEEIKQLNNNLPEKLEDGYKNIKENFKNKIKLFENVYGKCRLKIVKKGIEISNIKNNYKTRLGITINELYLLVVLIFSCLEKIEVKNLNEELKNLDKISKRYFITTSDFIKEIKLELKEADLKLLEDEITAENKLKLAESYMEEGYNTRYCMQKYRKLVAESVVIIKDAISQGIDYTVLNENKDIVQFNLNGHKEFVIEGNKTDRDSYIFPIITDDKFIAKQIMFEAGLNVPKAVLLDKEMLDADIENLVKPFYNKKLVVKPRNTNYGTGITVFSKKATRKQILNAIEYAFKFDTNVLIEEYVKGMEYRFLVVDGKCLSVAHRRVASVVGDGKSTIEELIDVKNEELWHKLTGAPIKKEQPVEEFLALQDYNYKTIIPKGKRVFLRTNSNCSTGGETIDMTQIMPLKFKKVAEKAAKAFDGKICGVDIIIDDLKDDKYSIIEINDNPGYSINEWPYEGKGEKIGISILELLGLVQ